jgi:GrpB-like predicted nucleotidyltransferase (UPF0157 family)
MRLLQPSDYQPALGAVFLDLSAEILSLLPDSRVEHIGASAIPGAMSKGDLDICVIVSETELEAAVLKLKTKGYLSKADTLRTPQLCMLISPRQDMDIALQMTAEGSEFEFFMLFRDKLRSDSKLVEQYNQLKIRYKDAEEDQYREQKSAFIQHILSKTY